MENTIVAMATAMGETSIHILRLSGSKAGKIIEECFKPQNMERWSRRGNFTLNLGVFKDEYGGEGEMTMVYLPIYTAQLIFNKNDQKVNEIKFTIKNSTFFNAQFK